MNIATSGKSYGRVPSRWRGNMNCLFDTLPKTTLYPLWEVPLQSHFTCKLKIHKLLNPQADDTEGQQSLQTLKANNGTPGCCPGREVLLPVIPRGGPAKGTPRAHADNTGWPGLTESHRNQLFQRCFHKLDVTVLHLKMIFQSNNTMISLKFRTRNRN